MQHVVSQLISKKEELFGELIYHKSKIKQLQEVLNGIDVSILAFDPEFDTSSIKPKRYTGRQQHYFARGESHRMILDTLRKADKPLSTSDITIELMKKKSLDYSDKKLVDNVQKSLLNTLKKQEKNNLIKAVDKDNYYGFFWVLAA